MKSPPRLANLDAAAVVLMVGCCLVWGLGQVAIKTALLEGLPPLLQAGLRNLGACALLVAWAAWRGVPLFGRDGSLRGGLLAGALFAGEFACIFLAQLYAPASRVTVFVYLAPFFVALSMPWLVRTERLDARQWTGLALAFSGVSWAFSEGFTQPEAAPLQWLGDLLGLGAALLWAGTMLAIRGTRLAAAGPEKTLAYQLAVSGGALALAGWLTGERWPAATTALALASFAFQAVIVAFASFLVWFWLVARYPSTRLMSFTLLTPLAALVFGVLLLDEPLTLQLAAAAAGVAGGLWLVNRR
jgi:drug/metabolite transporter (DMT)-like permease